MNELMVCFRHLRRREAVNIRTLIKAINNPSTLCIQGASLLYLVNGNAEPEGRAAILRRWPHLEILDAFGHGGENGPFAEHGVCSILAALSHGKNIGERVWRDFVVGTVSAKIPDWCISYVLMAIAQVGLSRKDRYLLAEAMRDSGKIFDYRSGLRPRKLVRRYPTGAVSEKAALILPALIAAAAEEVPLASNFLVARSLGFTGGTWDKLSSIDGFTFPRPGAAAEEILRRESVVMCVTSHDVAPCDRIFYQIRSLTGTIESHDLIVASIASKQGALPADSVLLDVRFGDGAFFETEHAAQLAAADITCLLGSWGIRCDSTFTDTSMPGGAAIGNALEVAEAIAIMTGSDDDFWIRPLLDAQWKLVRGFFSNLLRMEFPRCPFDEYESWADEIRRSGKLTRAFIRLLTAHGVEVAHAEELCLRSAPRAVGGRSHSVTSAHVGVVSRIDQKRLGYLVNFGLGGGGNEFGGIRDLRAGCVLRVFLGMTVNKGQTLCELFGNELCISSVIDEVRSCFSVK